MNIYAIEEEKGKFDKLLKLLGTKSFPGLSNAVKISANMIQRDWAQNVKKSTAKEGWKGEYIKSININFKDPLNAEVYADENNKFVNFIEDGVRRFDMKPGLLNGPKARDGVNGKYNIVFFRKGTPGAKNLPAMPKTIYKKIRKAELTQRHKRGDSKYKAVLTGLRGETKKNKSGKASIYEGLTKIGGKGQSQYGTFRVITKNSTGWIHPGSPPVKVFSLTKRNAKMKVKKILQEGLSLDIQSGLEYLSKK